MILKREFYLQPTLHVAKTLLGQIVVRQIGEQQLRGLIVETEAYIGIADTACHASKGKTERTRVMFGNAGYAYVYFIYGMHYMFNIVTEREGYPSAVLVRALQPLNGVETLKRNRGVDSEKQLTNGPAKLCQAYSINKDFNALDLCLGEKLWIEKNNEQSNLVIEKSPRVGIDYAEERDREALWRFTLKGNRFLSKK